MAWFRNPGGGGVGAASIDHVQNWVRRLTGPERRRRRDIVCGNDYAGHTSIVGEPDPPAAVAAARVASSPAGSSTTA